MMTISKQTETQLVKAAIEFLRWKGVWCWRNNTGAFAGEYKGKKRFVRFSEPGAPDIMGVLKGGRFLAVECKTAKGKQSDTQKAWQSFCEGNGGLYVLARNLDDIHEALVRACAD